MGEADGYVDLVTLSAPGPDAVSVNYATPDSTAVAGTACNFDYVAASGTLTFAPGETTKVVRVEILNCRRRGPRVIHVQPQRAVNATISRAFRIASSTTTPSSPPPAVRA